MFYKVLFAVSHIDPGVSNEVVHLSGLNWVSLQALQEKDSETHYHSGSDCPDF